MYDDSGWDGNQWEAEVDFQQEAELNQIDMLNDIIKSEHEAIDHPQLRVYDNGGESCDRYTVLRLDWLESKECILPTSSPAHYEHHVMAIGMSENPTHPQGFGQHTSAMDGSHLGKRIAFRDLPTSCQEVAKHFLED